MNKKRLYLINSLDSILVVLNLLYSVIPDVEPKIDNDRYFLLFFTGFFNSVKNEHRAEPFIGLEPMTYALPWRYSTTELKVLLIMK